MSLINPRTLYSGGDVALDSSPYRAAYQRQQLLQQAREDALDKYYQNLPNTINDKGVRDQDIPVIHAAKDQLQQYWMQNRDAIRKGNTPEAYNFQKLVRGTQGAVQNSINATDDHDKFGKYLNDPKYGYIKKDPKVMESLASAELPVNDPNYKPLDVDKLILPPPPFDQDKFSKNFTGQNALKPSTQITYQPIDGDRFNRTQVTTPVLSNDDLNKIHITSSTELANNPSFEKYLKENVLTDAVQTKALSDLFQQKYGHPVQDESDIAAAYTLSKLPLNPQLKTVKNDEGAFAAKNAQWLNRNAITNRQKKENIALNSGAVSSGVPINDVYSEIDRNQTTADNNPILSGDGQKAARFNTLNSGAQIVLMKAFKDAGHPVNADDVYSIRNKDGLIEYHQTEDGKLLPSESNRIFTVSRIGTNLGKQADVKGKRAVVATGEPNAPKLPKTNLKVGYLNDVH